MARSATHAEWGMWAISDVTEEFNQINQSPYKI